MFLRKSSNSHPSKFRVSYPERATSLRVSFGHFIAYGFFESVAVSCLTRRRLISVLHLCENFHYTLGTKLERGRVDRIAEPALSPNIGILFKSAPERRYAREQIIFYQGDPLTYICHIQKGFLKVYTILDSGEKRTLLILTKGDIFPIDFSLSLETEAPALKYFYESLTEVEAQFLERAKLLDTIQSNHETINLFLAYMAVSNQAITQQLEIMKNKNAINKVANLLPYLIEKAGEPLPKQPDAVKIKLRITHQGIADLAGLTRETATMQVKKLENRGVLRQQRGHWLIYTDRLSNYLQSK